MQSPKPDAKKQEGFVILNAKNVPKNLTLEINYYNGLVKTFDGTPQQQAAIENSEIKIRQQLNKHKTLYPADIMYGHLTLIARLQKPSANPVEFKHLLRNIQREQGDAYFKKLVIFNPEELFTDDPDWGWAKGDMHSLDLNATPMNILMLAIRNGKLHFVKALFDTMADVELKKQMLLQFLQYWDQDTHLLFKTPLDLAIESGSTELVDYLLSTMKDLGILSQAATAYEALVSTDDHPTNLVKKAAELEHIEILELILKYKSDLGRIWFVLSDKNSPDYIVKYSSFAPVFLTGITQKSPKLFNKLLEETVRAVDLNSAHSYLEAKYKIDVLASAISLIDLPAYIKHPDFNEEIFAKIMNFRIQLDKKLEALSHMKSQFVHQTSILLPTTENGLNHDTILARETIWQGGHHIDLPLAEKKEQLEMPKIFGRLFATAMSKPNLAAALQILYAHTLTGNFDAMNQLIIQFDQQQRDTMLIRSFLTVINFTWNLNAMEQLTDLKTSNYRDFFYNHLLAKAITTHNPTLIEQLSHQLFQLDATPFNALMKMQESKQFLFFAKELFHHIHLNQLRYDTHFVLAIFEKVSEISITHRDEDTKESIRLLMKEMEQSTRKLPNLSLTPVEDPLKDVLEEISANVDLNRRLE